MRRNTLPHADAVRRKRSAERLFQAAHALVEVETSYDLAPEMSAAKVAAQVAAALDDGHSLCVVNFANPDMVGHTGVETAVVRAVESADTSLGVVAAATHRRGGLCLVTADHGNAEVMIDGDGGPHTAHTTSPVPLVVTDPDVSLRDGAELSDLIPTALAYLGLDVPDEMTGAGVARLA